MTFNNVGSMFHLTECFTQRTAQGGGGGGGGGFLPELLKLLKVNFNILVRTRLL